MTNIYVWQLIYIAVKKQIYKLKMLFPRKLTFREEFGKTAFYLPSYSTYVKKLY